jgi:DNA-binding NarL/FixJ family response regulator
VKCRVISTLPSENGLTCCESEILSLLGHRKDIPSIVIILNSTRRITRMTVEVHVSNVRQKLDLHNVRVIILAAIELALAPCPCADCRLQEAA